MRKKLFFGTILILLGGAHILLGATAGIPLSVPSATSSGYMLVSDFSGRYIGTTTDPAHLGSIFATSTTATSTFIAGLLTGTLSVGTSSSATSTFSNGLQLSAGCIKMPSGTCLSGGGITSLNGLTGATQTFSATIPTIANGRYATLTITSTGTNHDFMLEATSSPGYGFISASSTNATSSIIYGLNVGNTVAASSLIATSSLTLGSLFTSLTGTGLINSAGVLTTSAIPNASLSNSSITVTAGTGLSGCGTVSLGGTITCTLVTPVTVARGGTNVTSFSPSVAANGAALVMADTLGTSLVSTSSPTLGWLYATTSTATSTFVGGLLGFNTIQASYINATSSLIIPTATNYIASTTGMVGLDTTVGQLIVGTSTNYAAVVRTAPVRLYSFRVASTTTGVLSSGTLGLPSEIDPFRVEFIQCYVFSGTSIVINLTHGKGSPDTNTVTCNTTSTSTKNALTSNTTYSAGEGASVEFGAVTGTISEVYISIFGSWLQQ